MINIDDQSLNMFSISSSIRSIQFKFRAGPQLDPVPTARLVRTNLAGGPVHAIGDEPVADAGLRQQVALRSWCGFKLFAQPTDIDVQ